MEVQFYNRYTKELETEQIYGERWLRWAYETVPGRASVHLLAKRAWFSRWYGWRMDRAKSARLIEPFIAKYQLDPEEFETQPEDFVCFNDFFARTLQSSARPIDVNEDTLVFPADGRHLGIPDLANCDGFYLKGQELDLNALIPDPLLAAPYHRGCAVISRLCPVDYHRFHFPAGGTPVGPVLVPGQLFSVNPIALRRNLAWLTENKRTLTKLETRKFGTILIIEIGATNVGSIQQSFTSGKSVAKGDEKGWFEFGGSMTITFFEPNRVTLAEDLCEHGTEQREVYAKMGDVMAVPLERPKLAVSSSESA